MTAHETEFLAEAIAVEARAIRDRADAVAHRVAFAVAQVLPESDPRRAERRLKMINETTMTAVHRFLDALDGAPHRDRGIEERFREIGARFAVRRTGLIEFRAAMQAATSEGWRLIADLELERTVTASVRTHLTDALFSYTRLLIEHTEAGFELGRGLQQRDVLRSRSNLAADLLRGRADPGQVETLPETLVVAVADLIDGHRLSHVDLSRHAVFVPDRERVILLFDPSERNDVLALLTPETVSRVALSWAVDRHHARAAYRWAHRALKLVENNTIPRSRIIDCHQHRTQIWLHSEPELRQMMVQELLPPLMAETPNSREILSETLLVWLETRDSAPAIAAILDVHPQTVRYRWKRINELFGEALHDPEFVLQLTMILKASLPLWKAGDQSDFERFRAGGQL